MTNCTQTVLEFPAVSRRAVQAEFSGGDITSDGGVLLLRQADRKLGLTKAISKVIADPRVPEQVTHTQLRLLRQRLYALCLGYEDLNDHTELRNDPAIQTAVEHTARLGSASTLCRLEQRMDRETAVRIHEVIVDRFIASYPTPPNELILDFDATDDPVHGEQEGRFFQGYYDCYCFLPLYVFCGDRLLTAYLRPSNVDGAKHAWAILALLVKRLRQAWPTVRIVFRGDGGFCRPAMLTWCERKGVGYIVGLGTNARLRRAAAPELSLTAALFEETGHKVRCISEFRYGARSWGKQRRVIARVEHSEQGANPRFIVTNLEGDPNHLYEKVYCARGEMENRIKEQLGLFADRTSAHRWWPNQFRLLLSSLAYVLMETIRRIGLKGTVLARAQMTTIRLKLLKIGAVILRNTRRIRFLLASAYPYKQVFHRVAAAFDSG